LEPRLSGTHGPGVQPGPYRALVSGSHTDREDMAVLTAEFASEPRVTGEVASYAGTASLLG
jgi:hypothetical protein